MEFTLEYLKLETYPSLIGSGLFLVAVACLLISFFQKEKRHATRLFSILVVASLALFSSHWATYFAAIFIVATAVTELEFLQTLAAIIRKDKNYFDFKKETITKEDNIRRKAEEVIEEELIATNKEDSTEDKVTIDLSKLANLPRNETMRLSLDVEDKALDYLENKYGKIERNVRFRKDGKVVEFDGVIGKGNSASKVFEIKWTRNPEHFFPFINHSIRRSKELIDKHEEITGHKPELHLLVITNPLASMIPERVEKLHERAKDIGIHLTLLSLSEIGIEVAQ
jgi:hypothetical protein